MSQDPIGFPSFLMPVELSRSESSRDGHPLLPEPLPAFLMRTLVQVEGMRGASRAALILPDGEELAALLVQGGKICYVERSLACAEATALLAEEDSQVLTLIGRLTRGAQGRLNTLSSLLRDIPPILVGRVREYLLSHMVRGILGLAWRAAGTPIEVKTTARFTGSFDSGLSFTPLEIYLRAVQTLDTSSRDVASLLFEQLADEFDLALILDREVDGHLYPISLRTGNRLPPLLRLGEIRKLIEEIATWPSERRIEPGFPCPLEIVSGGDSAWLTIHGTRRRLWFRLKGRGAVPRRLRSMVPRFEAAL